jgi:hypothetical protein
VGAPCRHPAGTLACAHFIGVRVAPRWALPCCRGRCLRWRTAPGPAPAQPLCNPERPVGRAEPNHAWWWYAGSTRGWRWRGRCGRNRRRSSRGRSQWWGCACCWRHTTRDPKDLPGHCQHVGCGRRVVRVVRGCFALGRGEDVPAVPWSGTPGRAPVAGVWGTVVCCRFPLSWLTSSGGGCTALPILDF